jgi:hypothetical protein
MLDNGDLKTTLKQNLGAMTPQTLQQAHEQLLSGSSLGKIVLQGMHE